MDKPSGNPLEQFVLLSKTAKGAAAVELIKQVLEAPGVYVFGELLDMPHIKELKNGPFANYYNLLHLFAYGSCSDYKANRDSFPALTQAQLSKLRHLTIVSLATKNKCLPYTLLLKDLEVSNLRELEDLIIEVVYADIIRGKLDQKHQQLEVDYAIGRDIKPENIGEIISVLQDWCYGCEALLVNIEQQVKRSNEQKSDHSKVLQTIESEVANIKKTLKATHQQDIEEQMSIDLPSTTDKAGKKSAKTKGCAHASKRPRTPCQSVTKSSPAKHLKSNEEEGVENQSNPNIKLLDFVAEVDDTVSHSLATEIGESVTNKVSSDAHVNKFSLVDNPTVNMNPSKARISDKEWVRKYKVRPIGTGLDVEISLINNEKQRDTLSHSLGTETYESVTKKVSSAARVDSLSQVQKPNTTATTSDIRVESGNESGPENFNGEGKVSSSAHQTTGCLNLEFYRNKIRSVPDGDYIENILNMWKDDFKKLERHHGYIQWLFPLKEIGMNNMAQVLQDDEAKAIREDAVLKDRVLRAYKMMLNFYGLVLTDDEVGIVGPSDLYEKRMEHLNSSFHNYLRITRILKSLGDLGFEHLKKPLLAFLINEAFVKNTLVNGRRSCVTFWIPTLNDKEEQKDLEKMITDLEKQDRRRTPTFGS